MSRPSSSSIDSVAELSVGRRRWIDVLVIAGGVVALVYGSPFVGGPLLAFGLVMPLLQWAGRRQRGTGDLLRLVTPELASSYRTLVEATRLQGIDDARAVIDAADDAVLEVAALLA